jgi:hypothetical protein
MAAVVIPTASLELVLQTPDEVLAWVESLPRADRAEVSPTRSRVCGRRRLATRGPSASPWLSGRAGRPSAVAGSRGRRTPTGSSRWPTALTRHTGGMGMLRRRWGP